MGGAIGVESRSGARLDLLVHRSRSRSMRATSRRPCRSTCSVRAWLVIDDHKVNRDILLEQLRSWNFDCAAVENGEVGLAFVDRADGDRSRVSTASSSTTRCLA